MNWKRGVPARRAAATLGLVIAAMVEACAAADAAAQAFPSRPIRWIVPFPPGGSTDISAFLQAEVTKWAKVIKQAGITVEGS